MAENDINEVMSCSPVDHNQFVMKSLQEQLVEGRNCDLEIRLRDNKLYVHKCLTDMFFTKLGADIEKDMFYLELSEFQQKMVAPLIDMMYHGILSVPRENIHDVEQFAAYAGFKQALDLLYDYRMSDAEIFLRGTDFFDDADENNGDGAVDSQSEDENSIENVIRRIRDTKKTRDNEWHEAFFKAGGPTKTKVPKPKTKQPMEVNGFVIKSEPPEDEEGEFNVPGYIADVLGTPLPNTQETAAEETSGEPSKHIYQVYTPNPYSMDKNVSEITSSWKYDEKSAVLSDLIRGKDNATVTLTDKPYETVSKIRQLNEFISPKGNSKGVRQGKDNNRKRKLKVKTEFNSANKNVKVMVGLNKELTPSIANKSVDVSVVHVSSPNPISRPKSDYINTKNFQEAAANRMLENSIVSSLVSKAKGIKTTDGLSVKELKIKDQGKAITSKEGTISKTKACSKKFKKKMEDPSFKVKKEAVTSTSPLPLIASRPKRENVKRKHSFFSSKTFSDDESDESDDSGESDESGMDMDEYYEMMRAKQKEVKYFPAAGTVPDGCKSSYAESCYTKTRKVTETVTNNRGDVMVVRKEIPLRRTIFNPKRNERGIAAVVVCHPTKPIVKF